MHRCEKSQYYQMILNMGVTSKCAAIFIASILTIVGEKRPKRMSDWFTSPLNAFCISLDFCEFGNGIRSQPWVKCMARMVYKSGRTEQKAYVRQVQATQEFLNFSKRKKIIYKGSLLFQNEVYYNRRPIALLIQHQRKKHSDWSEISEYPFGQWRVSASICFQCWHICRLGSQYYQWFLWSHSRIDPSVFVEAQWIRSRSSHANSTYA